MGENRAKPATEEELTALYGWWERNRDSVDGNGYEFAMMCGTLFANIASLSAWKAEALEVERSWNAQAIANLLGLKPGDDIRAAIQPAIERFQEALAPFARASANSGSELTREDFARAAQAASGISSPPSSSVTATSPPGNGGVDG